MKPRYYGAIGVILLVLGSSLGSTGTPEDSQAIRGLGGLLTILAIALIVFALIKRFRKKS